MTVDEYHRMVDIGVLTEDDAVELIAGEIVKKMPKSPGHVYGKVMIRRALEQTVPTGYWVNSQEPLTLSDSEPEPDVAVLRGEADDYLARHPIAEDAAFVVEVADVSLHFDRKTKGPIYAIAGISQYWIVNLVDEQIEHYADPSVEARSYRSKSVYDASAAIPVIIAGKTIGKIKVADVLPKKKS